MVLALGMLVLGVLVTLDARRDAWQNATQGAQNLLLALERDVERNIQVYDDVLLGVAQSLKEAELDHIPAAIRHRAIFGQTYGAEGVGSILVLDAAGNVIEDSTSINPHKFNFADRDYFQAHRANPGTGLLISRPFRSRLRNGDWTIALSRRLDGPDGKFAGIVQGAMRLSFFSSLFERLDIGIKGRIALFGKNGRMIVRYPFDLAEIDLDISASPVFQRMIVQHEGSLVAASMIDGLERYYAFRSLAGLPLVMTVSLPIGEIYATWQRKAIVTLAVMSGLSVSAIALWFLFRREMGRRERAETALKHEAEAFAVLAATDKLTSLANRRSFDHKLIEEWGRAVREGSQIAILLLDVDHFKLYNDVYGHQHGDAVLARVAEGIRHKLSRPGDFAARYGGEEFVALLPNTDLDGAHVVAEQIRDAINRLCIPHADGLEGVLTVSIGVASARPANETAPDDLIRRSDIALYAAKAKGRNRVSAATDVRAYDGTTARNKIERNLS